MSYARKAQAARRIFRRIFQPRFWNSGSRLDLVNLHRGRLIALVNIGEWYSTRLSMRSYFAPRADY